MGDPVFGIEIVAKKGQLILEVVMSFCIPSAVMPQTAPPQVTSAAYPGQMQNMMINFPVPAPFTPSLQLRSPHSVRRSPQSSPRTDTWGNSPTFYHKNEHSQPLPMAKIPHAVERQHMCPVVSPSPQSSSRSVSIYG